jgi:hypothetical protein
LLRVARLARGVHLMDSNVPEDEQENGRLGLARRDAEKRAKLN